MNPKDFEEFLEFRKSVEQKELPYVVLTLVQIDGSAPQDVGARAIVTREGLFWGSVGGGKIEKHLIELAREKLTADNPEPTLIKVNLQRDIGMTCGGLVSCFIEPCLRKRKWTVAVFGAGHVSQELIRTLIRLDADIHCIDSRPEWLEKLPSSSRLHRYHLPQMQEFVEKLTENTFIIVMTMGHATDVPILEKVFKADKNFAYVGVIGSETKKVAIKRELRERGVTPEKLEKLICPIGEDFGTNDPVEISYSVVAQLLKTRGNIKS